MAHVLAKELREAVLQAAMQGKLTEQLPTDTPVEETLKQIAKEKEKLIKEKKIKKEKPLPEIDEDETPFDIPESWQWERIGNLVDCGSGSTPSKSNPEYYCDGTIPWLLTGDLNDAIIEKVSGKITDKALKECSFRINHKNDILIALYGATIGKLGIVSFDLVTNQACLGMTPMIGLNYLYLYNVLKAEKQNLCEKAEGGAQPNISKIKVRNHPIPLPPIEEQTRIVAKVDELMAKINEYEKLENQLVYLKEQFPKDMKDSLLQAGMMGKLTEQLPTDARIVKYYDIVMSEAKKTSKKDVTTPLNDDEYDDLINLPNNWMYVRLNDLVSKEIRRGKSPKYNKAGLALSFAQKCNSKYSGIRLDLAQHLSDSSLNRYSEEDNMCDKDIVINSTGGGTLGRVGLYEDKFNPNGVPIYPDSHVTVVRVKKTVNSLYVYYCIKQQSEYLETLGEGSTNQTELNPQSVKDLIIPLPPIEEQARIVAKLDQLLPLVECLNVK